MTTTPDLLLEKFYNWSLKYLEIRPRSEKEIRDYLKIKIERGIKKGWLEIGGQKSEVGGQISVELYIDQVVDKLKKVDLINDAEFAKLWVESRSKSRSARILKGELFKKGITRETVDAVFFETLPSDENLLKKVAAKAFTKYQKLPSREAKQKLLAFLMRRGFDWEDVRGVVDELLRKG